MPTNIRRVTRPADATVSDAVYRFLAAGEAEPGDVELFMLRGSRDRLAKMWRKVRRKILAEWIRRSPCSRPEPWWECDAPRWDRKFGAWFDGTLPEPRRRLGGTGTEDFEVLCHVPAFDCGIPAGWVDKFQKDYYNGKAKNIHGEPIGTEFKEGDFEGVGIDASDPPVFESQAEYLRRHNLLTPAEVKHLAAHPELLAPELVTFDEDEDEDPVGPSADNAVLDGGGDE